MAHLNLIVTLMISSAICVYFVAWVMLCAGKRRSGIALFCTGWGINLSLVALNWVAGGHPPFGNMYHVLIFLGLCFLPACLALFLRKVTFRYSWIILALAYIACKVNVYGDILSCFYSPTQRTYDLCYSQ